MDLDLIATIYREKRDEELLKLASQKEQLTQQAQLLLASEMTRRNLAEGPVTIQKHKSNMDPQPHDSPRIRTGKFVGEVLLLYHENQWFFMKLVLPAVALSYACVMVSRHFTTPMLTEVYRELYQQNSATAFNILVWEIWIVRTLAYVVSWAGYCFSFGLICAAVDQHRVSYMSLQDSLATVRDRIRACFRLSLLLLFLTAAAIAIADFSSLWILRLLRHIIGLGYLGTTAVYYVPSILGLLAVTRFGLAMPGVVLDDLDVIPAMFRSDALSEGKWPILASLLAKAIVGGYVAGKLPFWLAELIPGPHVPWFSWTLLAASLAAVTIVEPVMFIGFALLYVRTSPAPTALTAHAVSA